MVLIARIVRAEWREMVGRMYPFYADSNNGSDERWILRFPFGRAYYCDTRRFCMYIPPQVSDTVQYWL